MPKNQPRKICAEEPAKYSFARGFRLVVFSVFSTFSFSRCILLVV